MLLVVVAIISVVFIVVKCTNLSKYYNNSKAHKKKKEQSVDREAGEIEIGFDRMLESLSFYINKKQKAKDYRTNLLST